MVFFNVPRSSQVFPTVPWPPRQAPAPRLFLGTNRSGTSIPCWGAWSCYVSWGENATDFFGWCHLKWRQFVNNFSSPVHIKHPREPMVDVGEDKHTYLGAFCHFGGCLLFGGWDYKENHQMAQVWSDTEVKIWYQHREAARTQQHNSLICVRVSMKIGYPIPSIG
jgi:hypothetical protein